MAVKFKAAYELIREGRYALVTDAEKDLAVIKSVTEAQLEAGLITEQQAIERYETIRKSSFLESQTRLDAAKRISEILKQEGERQVETYRRQLADIEQATADQTLSKEQAAIAGAETEIKIAETSLANVKKRLQARREYEIQEGIAFGAVKSQAMRQLEQELDQVETQLAQARRKKRDAEYQEELAGAERQMMFLDRSRKQLLINEDQYFTASNDIKIKQADIQI